MAGIFISHSTADEETVKDFACRFLVFESNVSPIHIFNTFFGSYVPGGKMMYARIFAALYDSEVMIVIASKKYFESKNCLMELGASFSPERKNVFYFLAPGLSVSEVPSEFSWIPWRYLHDEEALENCGKAISGSDEIDFFNNYKQIKIPSLSYCEFISDKINKPLNFVRYIVKKFLFGESNLIFSDYVFNKYQYPKIISSKPLRGNWGKNNAAYGLMVFESLEHGMIPLVYTDRDQVTLMNSDGLVEEVKRIAKSDVAIGLWPDKDFQVTIQEGNGGGTKRRAESEVYEKYGIHDIVHEIAGAEMDMTYEEPQWFIEWCREKDLL